VANIHEAVGHNVTRLNYLGDWGTQFGYLLVGLDRSGNTEPPSAADEAADPLRHLLDVYVRVNQEAATNASIEKAARSAFSQLEADEPGHVAQWAACRQLSIEALTSTYARLNIKFDSYDGESMYNADAIRSILTDMSARGILRQSADGRQVVDVTEQLSVTVVKSDGSSLYMSRDIAAAIDRWTRFGFDKMFYVVDNSQAIHFTNLFHILNKVR
jgi:arginyl-tRNA synthetase